jgi:predicted Rossmann-fold nucleotide-binding protein
VRRSHGRVVEVESREDAERRLASGVRDLGGWRVRSVDLTGLSLADRRVAGAMFLGCRLDQGITQELQARGALVFPELPDSPLDVYRGTLYTAPELYGTGRYHASVDARAYAWSQEAEHDGPDALLAAALHDHAIDVALDAWARDRSLVGVMGGHAVRRGEASYAEAARLGRLLGARHTVATGGGPGAMEAANLGAALAAHEPAVLEDALVWLAGVPDFDCHIGAWAGRGFEVLEGLGDLTDTLGIPTWHYGHEPPNVFATAIAKYVRNAVREAVLVEICRAGIVFLPGAAGTVQEVFQDACENYYADPASVAPMVLVGVRHWTEQLPVWPLLQSLAEGRGMADHVHLVDDVEEAVEVVTEKATGG